MPPGSRSCRCAARWLSRSPALVRLRVRARVRVRVRVRVSVRVRVRVRVSSGAVMPQQRQGPRQVRADLVRARV